MSKFRIRAAIAVSSILLATGCATTSPDYTARSAAAPRDRVVYDSDLMTKVEKRGMKRGVMVVWVNPPTRRIAAETSD